MKALPHPERLTDLWRLGPSEVIAIVGAGGKTALMEALACDYEAEGARVLLTTTTKIRRPEPGGRPLVTGSSVEELARALDPARTSDSADVGTLGAGGLASAVRPGVAAPAAGGVGAGPPVVAGRSPVVGRRVGADGKVEGVPPEWVSALRDLPGVAAVLVEADGAAGRPLKAPAAWEPVVPPCASLVVAVAGLDAQGVPLDPEHVHRPELLAGLLGLAAGTTLPPSALLEACVRGYERRAPGHSGFLVFLNKSDVRPPAPALIEACAASGFEVWSGSVGSRRVPHDRADDVGDRELEQLGVPEPRPAVLVPAAGLAARMGGPKVLAALGGGTVLGRVVAAALESGVAREVVVVAGRDADGVEALTAGAARLVVNPSPGEGMASSLRAGLAALRRPAGLLVLLGDQPFVRAATLRRLVEERRARPRAAAVGLAGGPGGSARPPVLLHRSLLPRVLELRGDEGARNLLARHVSSLVCVPGAPEEALDVDRPEDLEAARRLLADGVRE